MSILPFIEIDINQENEKKKDENTEFREPLFDFVAKKVIIKDGKVIMTDKKQHIQQWITLLIHTEVEKFRVYQGTEFGLTNLYSLQGQQILTTPFGIAEIKRELKEKVEKNKNIESIKNITVTVDFNKVIIDMVVEVKGEEIKSGVVFNL